MDKLDPSWSRLTVNLTLDIVPTLNLTHDLILILNLPLNLDLWPWATSNGVLRYLLNTITSTTFLNLYQGLITPVYNVCKTVYQGCKCMLTQRDRSMILFLCSISKQDEWWHLCILLRIWCARVALRYAALIPRLKSWTNDLSDFSLLPSFDMLVEYGLKIFYAMV